MAQPARAGPLFYLARPPMGQETNMIRAVLNVAGLTTAAGLGTFAGLAIGEGLYRGFKALLNRALSPKPKARSARKKAKTKGQVLTLRKGGKNSTTSTS